ncbi:hypothetical protein ATY41_05595 [Leifsonia xyli subsp. xyli]|nr:DUF3846 domain-containing protein [Leifsonia xyli]ODA89388.1 hypothetical protein ATY41_05595 [Leifsonia xyli subsp. xyli]
MLSEILIDPHGGISNVWCSFTSEGQRQDWMRGHIGADLYGFISLPEDIDVWVDDEGLYRGAPVNVELTRMIDKHRPTTPIHGNGLILGVNQDGDVVSLTLDQQASVVAWWRSVTTNGTDPDALRPRMALV